MRGALLVLVAGCGRLAFDGRQDAGPIDGPCTWTPFSAPIALPSAIQSPFDDWMPAPTAGGLQLFFHSYRSGSGEGELWFATRTSTTASFGVPSPIPELTTGTSQQFDPTLSSDGLHLIYAESVGAIFQLQEASRPSTSSAFGPPTPLATINNPTMNWNPYLSADGLRLMFTSTRVAGYDEIFETTRTSYAAAFAPPMRHGELTVPNFGNWSPTLSSDGLELFFSSLRPGGPGGFDVYTTHRVALDQPFAAPVLVPELSSPNDDVGVRMTTDGTTMYLDYNAFTQGGGNADLMMATRSCN